MQTNFRTGLGSGGPAVDPGTHVTNLARPPAVMFGAGGQQQFEDAYRQAAQSQSVDLSRAATLANQAQAEAVSAAQRQSALAGLSQLGTQQENDQKNRARSQSLLAGLFNNAASGVM